MNGVPKFLGQGAIVDQLDEVPSIVVFAADGVTTYAGIHGDGGREIATKLDAALDEMAVCARCGGTGKVTYLIAEPPSMYMDYSHLIREKPCKCVTGER